MVHARRRYQKLEERRSSVYVTKNAEYRKHRAILILALSNAEHQTNYRMRKKYKNHLVNENDQKLSKLLSALAKKPKKLKKWAFHFHIIINTHSF